MLQDGNAVVPALGVSDRVTVGSVYFVWINHSLVDQVKRNKAVRKENVATYKVCYHHGIMAHIL